MLLVIKNVAFFYNEITKLILFGILFFNIQLCKKKRVYFVLMLGSFGFGGVAYYVDKSVVSIVNILLLIIFAVIMVPKLNLRYIILGTMVITLIDCIIVFVVMCFGRISADQILNNSIINFISNCVLTIVLFFMLLVKRWRGYRAFYLDLDFKIVCVLIVGAISSILFVTYTEEYGFDVEGNLREKAGAVSLIVFGSLFYLLQCIGMFFYIRNKKLVEVMALREQFLQQQKRYYTVLLAKEEETKRFRHDIRGHVNSLRVLLEEKDYEGASIYLNSIDGYMSQTILDFNTGNHIVNAIVADIKRQYKNVSINWKGMIPNNIQMKDIDVCIIFSNLINNACREVNESNEPVVDVGIKLFQTNMFIEIKNVIIKSSHIAQNYRVMKYFEDGHGYGLRNVEDCVLSYKGSFNICNQNGIFLVNIMLPNII